MTSSDRNESARMSIPRVTLTVARGLLGSVVEHWRLSLFSLVAAFVIWFVIQDVENPRVEAVFPEDGAPASIVVKPVNADRLIPNDEYRVSVDVEGREADLKSLTVDDFEATIDVKGIPANTPTEVPVRVTSSRNGVKVLAVHPPTVSVTVEPLIEQEFEVRLNPTGQLVAGYEVADRKLEPLTVKVSGLQDRINNVTSVDFDVNLSALREGTNVIEGEFRARSLVGNEVGVTVTPNRGRVTYTVRQLNVTRSVPVIAATSGVVAPGYRITNLVVEPATISVSGPADRMASLTELRTEAVPVTNATGEIRLTRNIDTQLDNLTLERKQVSVRVAVEPIVCAGSSDSTPCSGVTLPVAPLVVDQPGGLVVTNALRLNIQLTGPLVELAKLTPTSITARISLANAVVGTGFYPVTVVIPANLSNLGIRAETPPAVQVTLEAATP